MNAALPLHDLVVVEIGVSVAGPFGASVFAELGAEVFKIENPERGDDARAWGPPFVDGSSALFNALNRSKNSVAIDFKDETQLDALKAFIQDRADIVLQNMRPGIVDRFGLDGDSLRAAKPSLIYCNMGAYGSGGPLEDRAGYDPLMQAFAGIMSVTGEEGRDPVRVGPSLIDVGTGMWAVIGILSALHRRTETGEGCTVDSSLFETGLAWMGHHSANYLGSGVLPKRFGTENSGIAPYRAFKASDDWLVIAAGNDNLFTRLANALGHPEWPSDPDFATNPSRVTNRGRVNDMVSKAVAANTASHWIKTLEAAGVPCAPLQNLEQVLDHPQTKAMGMMQDPPEGTLRLMGLPLRFDGERPPYRHLAPALGRDTGAVTGNNKKTTKD